MFLLQMIFAMGSNKYAIIAEVKLVLAGREDEPLCDVGAGTGIVGRFVSYPPPLPLLHVPLPSPPSSSHPLPPLPYEYVYFLFFSLFLTW